MKTCTLPIAALGVVLLAGCVAYPAGGYGDAGYPPGTYPDATSPNGYPPGNYPPANGYPPPNGYPGAGYGPVVRCESTDNRTRHCDMDTRGGVVLSRRLSDSACIQGRNWGYDSGGVWVTGGCRAEFSAGGGGYAAPGYGGRDGGGQVVRCESEDGHSRHCNASIQRGARLLRTLSDSACIQGSTWGWDRSGVWVDRGCRAEFNVY
jgi:DUF3011 family protein